MVRKFAALSVAVAVISAYSPAYSLPLAPLKADTNVTLVGKGDGDGGKKWSGGNKKWGGGDHDGKKGWSNKGWDGKKWSGKGRGGKKWSKYGNWHAGQRHHGYWRNGIFVTLPFVVGDQCYDYLDWRDGFRPGWYWVC